MTCLGCTLANQFIDTHVVYEDEWVTCILDIDPLNEGHTLILPKQHVLDLEELEHQPTLMAIMNASVRISKALKALYNPDGITIMQNGGTFNDLEHYHMHVFPRFKDDGFGWIEPTHALNVPLTLVKEKLIERINPLK